MRPIQSFVTFVMIDDMKRHLKSHSFKEANYTYEDCGFIGKHDLTMEVHLGKFHSEKIECGICGFEAKDMEMHKRTFIATTQPTTQNNLTQL